MKKPVSFCLVEWSATCTAKTHTIVYIDGNKDYISLCDGRGAPNGGEKCVYRKQVEVNYE